MSCEDINVASSIEMAKCNKVQQSGVYVQVTKIIPISENLQ